MTKFFFETSTCQTSVRFRKFNKIFHEITWTALRKEECFRNYLISSKLFQIYASLNKETSFKNFFIDNSNHILCSFRVDQTVNQEENYFGSVTTRTRILTEMVSLTILMTTMTTMGFPIAKTTTTMAME